MYTIQPGAMFFYTSVLAFVGGVALRSFVDLGVGFGIFIAIIGVAIATLVYINSLEWPHNNTVIKLCSIALITASIGIVRFDLAEDTKDTFFENSIGQRIEFEAVVVDEPDIREKHQFIIVESVKMGQRRILLLTELFPNYHYGDMVFVVGEVEKPQSFETDTGRMFNYPAYLAKDGIYYQMFYPKVDILSRGQGGSALKRSLFTLKNEFMNKVAGIIPEPHSSLLGGLLLGIKQSLGKELLEDFRAVGLIHVVVLSGYNITIDLFGKFQIQYNV
jgi:competence protein ComEC